MNLMDEIRMMVKYMPEALKRGYHKGLEAGARNKRWDKEEVEKKRRALGGAPTDLAEREAAWVAENQWREEQYEPPRVPVKDSETEVKFSGNSDALSPTGWTVSSFFTGEGQHSSFKTFVVNPDWNPNYDERCRGMAERHEGGALYIRAIPTGDIWEWRGHGWAWVAKWG